jgi:hypothetical protein
MLSEVVPGDTTDQVLAPVAAVAPLAWDLEEVVSVVVEEVPEVAVDGAGSHLGCRNGDHRSTE